ncbi:hypothetical protein [Methylomicrobium sp. Wu6]|uniref:hypothetical protein n=1 Tax=Methylomicrobium sp. Wu6 TaxID=3107928 RepID=UPI002DD6549E|nr:hypothetical protein [Methylomicrobium sp. Wu6]MEC4750259.1 hypothetical protein [Methylomicrobium sp. Wu6]
MASNKLNIKSDEQDDENAALSNSDVQGIMLTSESAHNADKVGYGKEKYQNWHD